MYDIFRMMSSITWSHIISRCSLCDCGICPTWQSAGLFAVASAAELGLREANHDERGG